MPVFFCNLSVTKQTQVKA